MQSNIVQLPGNQWEGGTSETLIEKERESLTAHTWAEDLWNWYLFQVGLERSLGQGSHMIL